MTKVIEPSLDQPDFDALLQSIWYQIMLARCDLEEGRIVALERIDQVRRCIAASERVLAAAERQPSGDAGVAAPTADP